VPFEIQAHRGNDPFRLKRRLASQPTSLELDVGLTSDGRLLVAHEYDLSDATGMTLGEARALSGDLPLVVEVKCAPPLTPPAAAFAYALRPFLRTVSVISFDERVLIEVRKTCTRTPLTILFAEPLRRATVATTLGPQHELVTRELVEAAHATGMRVVPWTVNDSNRMAELIDLGVDGLATDFPALAHALVAERLRPAA
jgi:glycerophosphoryl diester phosphodiesterase